MSFKESLDRFKADHPDPQKVAFLIMRFEDNALKKIQNELHRCFSKFDIKLLRADEHSYSSDLFENTETYMHGCGMGVAIFDRIESDEFNPNVSLEVGYMLALKKPIALFQERTMKTLHSDIISKLYLSYDSYNPEVGVENEVGKWIKSNNLCPNSHDVAIELHTLASEYDPDSLSQIQEGIALFCNKGCPPDFVGIKTSANGNALILYKGNEYFKDELLSMREDLRERIGISDIRIESPGEQITELMFQNIGNESGEYSGQYCFLECFRGLESEAETARKILPSLTNKIDECAIYCTKLDDGKFYFHSNYLIDGHVYPTKFIAYTFNGLKNILPVIIGDQRGNIYVTPELSFSHATKVKYIFDRSITTNGKDALPFDDFGAQNVTFID